MITHGPNHLELSTVEYASSVRHEAPRSTSPAFSSHTPNEPDCPNSHTPMLERYQRTLLAYAKIVDARTTPRRDPRDRRVSLRLPRPENHARRDTPPGRVSSVNTPQRY